MNGLKQKLIYKIVVVATAFSLAPFQVLAQSNSLAFWDIFRPFGFSSETANLTSTATMTEEAVTVTNVETTNEEVEVAETEILPEAERLDRIERIDQYFTKRNMPLAGYGEQFVDAAEKCDIDWRLLPAISVRESSGGKHDRNNNPFGWASARVKFDDYAHAINTVADHLCGFMPTTARYYKDKTTYQRLWAYNGTVLHSYPKEVIQIMEMM